MSCPSAEQLAEFATGSGESREAVERHLDTCSDCRRVVAEVAGLESTRAAGSGPASPLAPLAKGTLVGRYEVQSVAGAGGMGVIYAAHDPTLNRSVALKLVRPGRMLDGAARLLAEAKVMARLAHPDVLPVFDAGSFGDEVFIAMEWVDGQTLRGWLASKQRTWREVLEVFVHAGRGLAAAHAAGVIHRDFKPENVLVGRDGRVRVSDFGLARLLEGSGVGGVTAAGTLAYMAPEQRTGGAITPAVDQYSFGVALTEALGKDSPRWLKQVAARARQEAPSKRFGSMNELLRALHPPASKRWLLAALPLLLVIAWFATRPDAETLCAGSDTKIDAVWNATRRQQLLSNSDPAFARVAELLDGYSRRWRSARREACLATHLHHEQSEQVLDLEMSCFQQQLSGVDALLNSLSKPGNAAKAIEATQQAISIQRCTDVALLTAASGGVLDDDSKQRSSALRERMARVKQLLILGPFQQAGEDAAQLVTDAKAIGIKAVEAEAQLLHAQALLQLRSRPEDAAGIEAALDEAVLAGTESKYPQLVVEAWLERLRLCTQDGRFDEGVKHERMATAHLQGLGVAPWLQARHDQLHAALLMRLNRGAEALTVYEHGQEMARLLPEAETARLRADLTAGEALARIVIDDLAGARARLLEAVKLGKAAYGERYSRLAEYTYNLGGIDQQLGRFESALAAYDEAGAIWGAAYGPATPRLGVVETSRADVLSLLARHDEAFEALQRAKDLFTKAGLQKEYFFLRVLCAEGDLQRRRGNLEASARAFTEGLAIAATAKGQFPFDAPACAVAFSHTLIAQHRYAEAREKLAFAEPPLATSPVRLAGVRIARARIDVLEGKGSVESLEQSLTLLDAQNLEPTWRAWARLSLAKLQPERAKELTARAAAELPPGESGVLQ